MNLKSLNLKLILGIIYLAFIAVVLYFLFSFIDIKDLTNYELLKSNKDNILKYKNDNFIFLALVFSFISIVWTLLMGFASPLLLFAGFVFGQWWGIFFVLISTTLGATLLYLLATLFLKQIIEEKLAPKFSKLKEFFRRNDTIYFMCFRFVGGGGTPFGIQNILPVLFSMPVKNYIIATFFGSAPSMFVTVALASGIGNVMDKDMDLSIFNVLSSPEIYVPLLGFFVILISGFIIKKFYFKT